MLDKTSPEYLAQYNNISSMIQWYREHAASRKSINIMLITCSTVNPDDDPVRTPSSEQIGLDTLELARKLYPDQDIQTKVFKLREIDFKHCEANYSIASHYCTWPCRISQRMSQAWKADPLTELYYSLVDRCDIVLIATPSSDEGIHQVFTKSWLKDLTASKHKKKATILILLATNSQDLLS